MISKKAKYALNALLFIARTGGERRVRIGEICEGQHIPRKFLEAIMLDLKNAGILGSKRGPGGGYFLIKPPSEVNMAQVLRLMDGPIALMPCVTYAYYQRCEECVDEATCALRRAFRAVRNQTVAIFKLHDLQTLIDMERNPYRDAENAELGYD